MQIAVLSDIHANLEALRAIFEALNSEPADLILCCGDIVGYGPNPNECIELLVEHDVACVQGNHDACATGKASLERLDKPGQQALRWTQKTLSKKNLTYLKELPQVQHRMIEDMTVGIVHGSPADPLWEYMLRRRDVYLGFRLSEEKPFLQLFGHTHLPAVFHVTTNQVERMDIEGNPDLTLSSVGHWFLNPGSVGQPRDGSWRASLCLLSRQGTSPWNARFRRLEYNVETTRQKIIAAGLPRELSKRLLTGS